MLSIKIPTSLPFPCESLQSDSKFYVEMQKAKTSQGDTEEK